MNMVGRLAAALCAGTGRSDSRRTITRRKSMSLAALAQVFSAAALTVSAVAFAQTGPVLSGVLGTPPGTTGTVTAYAIYLSGDRLKALTHGSLDATGAFAVTLPATVDTALLNTVDTAGLCASGHENVAVSPSEVLHAMVMFVMWLGEESGAGAVIASSSEMFDRLSDDTTALEPGDLAVYHLYAAAPFRLAGTCVGEGFPLALDIDAPAGWSLVGYGHGGDGLGTIRVASIEFIPPEASWRTFSD